MRAGTRTHRELNQAILLCVSLCRLCSDNNAVAMTDKPALCTRAFFWQLYRQRATLAGSLSWWSDNAFASINGSAVSPWHSDGIENNRIVNGDGEVFYDPWHAPDIFSSPVSAAAAPYAPLSSIRWEMLVLGLQDYELLVLAGRRNASATDALAAKVSERFPRTQPANDQLFTVDCRTLEWARAQLISIAELPPLAASGS